MSVTNPFHATDRCLVLVVVLPCFVEVCCSVLIINTHEKQRMCVFPSCTSCEQAAQNYVSSQFGNFRNLGPEIDVAEYSTVRVYDACQILVA
jgi:hypothetical protein